MKNAALGCFSRAFADQVLIHVAERNDILVGDAGQVGAAAIIHADHGQVKLGGTPGNTRVRWDGQRRGAGGGQELAAGESHGSSQLWGVFSVQ